VAHEIDCDFDSQYNGAHVLPDFSFGSTRRMGNPPMIPPIDPVTPNEKPEPIVSDGESR
jgi:hypothetical protein